MSDRVGIGIDFGTSNSSLALFDGEQLVQVSLAPEVDGGEVMPTALYLNRDLKAQVGHAAIDAYTRDNAGRTIQLERELIAQIEVTVAGTDNTPGTKANDGALVDWVQAHAFTDQQMPGRLFRSLKRWLGNRAVERVRVFDASYRIVALVTPVLQAIQRAAGSAGPVHLGRPVVFEGRADDANTIALERLLESAGYAGLRDVQFYPEPIAASLSFLYRHPSEQTRNVVTFDFGGGTLDLCALRATGEAFEILATGGVPLGGDRIDALLYRAKIFPELGEGTLVRNNVVGGPDRIPFLFRDLTERLLNWQLSHELNQPSLRERIALGAREPGEAGVRLRRLRTLVSQNLSYPVYRAIERAKIELSSQPRATIDVPELDLSVEIDRHEFEELLTQVLPEVEQAVDALLDRAALAPNAVDLVVRTGGSAQIPAIARLLERRFPDRVVEHDTFTSIASGLAIASHLDYRWD